MLGATARSITPELSRRPAKILQVAFERSVEKQILRFAQDDIFGLLSF